MWERNTALAVVLVLVGCEAGSAVTAAVLNTAVGVAVAGARVADGECPTPCTPGTTCNRESQLCERIPCNGDCDEGQYCDESGVGSRCVYLGDPGLVIEREPDGQVAPDPHSAE